LISNAFCVAEHRSRIGVVAPGMARRAAHDMDVDRRDPDTVRRAGHRTQAGHASGWPFFWFRLFWPRKKDERGLAASQDLPWAVSAI